MPLAEAKFPSNYTVLINENFTTDSVKFMRFDIAGHIA